MKYAPLFLLATLSLTGISARADEPVKIPETIDELIEFSDLNSDGLISREEFLIVRLMMFDRVDTDKSGGLTHAEFEKALNDTIKRFSKRAFKKVDSNKDGIVSSAEWKAHPPVAFDKADANKDGKLTPEEREAKRFR